MADESTNTFIVMWDMYGLESVVDAFDLHQQDLFDRLSDVRGNRLGQQVFFMIMRARHNEHRQYEIWGITTDSSIDADDMRAMFDDNPQGAADLIRSRGKCIVSHRHLKQVIS